MGWLNGRAGRALFFAGAVAASAALVACAPGVDQVEPEPVVEDATPADWTADGILALTLPELAEALSSGETSSVALTEAYLARIADIDDPRPGAPSLQSVLSLNPDAVDLAATLDAERAAGTVRGPLHGLPILLKDNIETADPVPTTAGALALAQNMTGRDSPLVAGLRAQGAIILGKTNLSQWANFRSSLSLSGWSALGGQVRNPHVLDRNPCGSSSGSGAGVAASLAAGAVGTETNGSIICPSNVNGIVGFKPTVGLVSQEHIIPISSSQDTAGPMTRSVRGAAMMMDAMATGPRAGAGAGADVDSNGFAAGLDSASLEGTRIGVLRFATGEQPDILARFEAALAILEAAGAELVEIEDHDGGDGDFWRQARMVLDYEFKATLNEYLAGSPADLPVRTLDELIAFNLADADIELSLFGQDIFETANEKGDLMTAEYVEARDAVQAQTRARGIDKLLADNDVAVLVAPSGPLAPRIDPVNGDVWPDWAGAGAMAAIAGYPHLTVPMGEVHGVPLGLSFMAGADDDGAVLSYGYAFEQASELRPDPQYLPKVEVRPEVAAAIVKAAD